MISMRHTEALLHDRTRGRVLQELLLGGVQMMLNREGGKRRLVESGKNQFSSYPDTC
jgi:hypothetical protein